MVFYHGHFLNIALIKVESVDKTCILRELIDK